MCGDCFVCIYLVCQCDGLELGRRNRRITVRGVAVRINIITFPETLPSSACTMISAFNNRSYAGSWFMSVLWESTDSSISMCHLLVGSSLSISLSSVSVVMSTSSLFCVLIGDPHLLSMRVSNISRLHFSVSLCSSASCNTRMIWQGTTLPLDFITHCDSSFPSPQAGPSTWPSTSWLLGKGAL